MTKPYDNHCAVVALPAAAGWLQDARLRRWLGQGDIVQDDMPASNAERLLVKFGAGPERTGYGALRMWGQTGERPTRWIAAADPVCLEPRMDHLWLYSLDREDVPMGELRALVDHLQRELGEDGGYGFARLGCCAYLSSAEPVEVAKLSARAIGQGVPNEFLPSGEGADAYRRLTSEIEMALHDHPVNVERAAAGRRPVNAFWIWGGGNAPEIDARALPQLFSDDPLLAGYWLSRMAPAEPWPGSVRACLDKAPGGFVATIDDNGDAETGLLELRQALARRRIRGLELRFADGTRIALRRRHSLRFWRRPYPCESAPGAA